MDGPSAGTDYKSFQTAKVIKNMPGDESTKLSLGTNTNFPLTIQMPQGMVRAGNGGGADNERLRCPHPQPIGRWIVWRRGLPYAEQVSQAVL